MSNASRVDDVLNIRLDCDAIAELHLIARFHARLGEEMPSARAAREPMIA
jgi:hypothetical protein